MKIIKRFQYNSKNIFPEKLTRVSPFFLFDKCFQLASQKVKEPNQMVLATVNKENRPSSRVVLLKEWSTRGFVFYTNYGSAKGKEIEENPWVALNFYWDPIKIQIRIEGKVKKISLKKSGEYFHSRPLESQLGAILSKQSNPLANYNDFLQDFKEKLKEKTQLVKPQHWGGYEVSPDYFEFWQGKKNRLHERVVFRKEKKWKVSRLYP